MQTSRAASKTSLLDDLKNILGATNVLSTAAEIRRYATGYRFGSGSAVAVARPKTLVQAWRVLQTCVAHDSIIIMQSANTGLTGGSTPHGEYSSDVVIINTMRITGTHLLDGGKQVICLPGTTLYHLENILKPLQREPHSVIGSSCIGASVFGGVCNNSGGALVNRGPAYTQFALYAQLDHSGQLHLVNHLGINLGDDPETILTRIAAGDFSPDDVEYPPLAASDHGYAAHVRDITAPTPARFNADPTRLFEASGSAGKIMLFAVRLDTFPQEKNTAVFYIGSNDAVEFTALRRKILSEFKTLPVACEYIHRDAYDIAATYGKDTFLAIQYLGTNRLPKLFALKGWLDDVAARIRFLPNHLGDRLLQAASRLFPKHLPRRMQEYRDRFEHHLIIKCGGEGAAEYRQHLSTLLPSPTGAYFECTAEEAIKAFLHRFVVASSAVRYRAVHQRDVEDIIALDIALRRDDSDWLEILPEDLSIPILHKLYYGHFLCHVFHQDYIIAKGHDPEMLEHRMLEILDQRGAEYPAEHNVGHLYNAKPALAAHYRNLDPCNVFNPGIGRTTKQRYWCDPPDQIPAHGSSEGGPTP